MFYRSTDVKTSTSDWVSFAFNAIDQETMTLAAGEELYEKVQRIYATLDVPDMNVDWTEDEERFGITLYLEPEERDYSDLPEDERAEAFAEDHKAWEAYDAAAREEIESREDDDHLPMWSTMWHSSEIRSEHLAMLHKAGFRVYDASEIGIDGYLIGVNGAGYDFYGAHWIPLRALVAAECLAPWDPAKETPKDRARRKRESRKVAAFLRAEGEAKGEKKIAEVEALAKAA